MANCVYILFDRTFSSELELDNFIMNNKNLLSISSDSDIVFSTRHTLSEVDAILEQKKLETNAIRQQLENIRAKKGRLTPEEERTSGKYQGVTKFIQLFVDPDTHKRLTPRYIEDNLKLKLFERWATEGIAENHAALLGIAAGTKITTEAEQDDYFRKLKAAWDLLGEKGTITHRVMELLWLGKTLDEIKRDPEIAGKLSEDNINNIYNIQLNIKGYLTSKPNFTNAIFKPEYPILAKTTALNSAEEQIELVGIVDLLVIDNDGKVHIFDYKCSDKDFEDWYQTKLLNYIYLTGLYKMAIESYGIDTAGGMMGIIPLIFDRFNGRTGEIQHITYDDRFNGGIVDYTPQMYPGTRIANNIVRIIINDSLPVTISNDFMIKVNELIKQMFPSYRFLLQVDEAIRHDLEKDIRFNPNTGKWELPNPYDYQHPKQFDSEAEAILGLEEYQKALNEQKKDYFRYYSSLIKRAIVTGDPSIISLEESRSRTESVSKEWFQVLFSQYCTGNGEWETIDIPEFEAMGIMILHNKVGGYYRFYILDNTDPNTKVELKKGKSILGNFIDDISPEQIGVTPLVSDIGNINNMKVMIALNCFPDVIRPGETIEGIYPICPKLQLGHHANSKQLTDNFKILSDYAGIENNFANGKLRFQEPYEVAYQLIRECGAREEISRGLNRIYSKYESNVLEVDNTLKSLLEAKSALEELYPDLNTVTDKGIKVDFTTPQGIVYGKICQAIAEISNGYYTQEFRSSSTFSHYIDNPETLTKNLRTMYLLTTNLFENFKRDMNRFAAEFREKLEKLWKAKGYSLARRNTLNDERVIYENMYEQTNDHTFKFKDPWNMNNNLTPEEREFLKWALIKFAKLRDPSVNTVDIDLLRNDPESGFFDVPLVKYRGTKNPFTESGRKGIVSWFKKTLDYFKNFGTNIKKSVTETLTPEDSKRADENAAVFRIFDVFEASDNQVKRQLVLQNTDVEMYDKDLGYILYMYAGAKIRKRVMDHHLPIIKAHLVLYQMEAATNNILLDKNIDYILTYVRAKIMNLSIVPEDYRILAKGLENVRTIATYLTLGFSPKAGLFQMLEGVWKNASRAGIKPLGENLFGIEELKKASAWVIGDTKDHFQIVSLGELINEQYAINDMDVNLFAKRLYEGQFPLEFSGKAMWLTSAPDYFNRMSIFIAQMIKDGCFKAHVKKGMRLLYDWKLDDRFSAFANNDRSDMTKYNKQKGLYKAMMEQFIREGYMVEDENGNRRPLRYDPASDTFQDPIPQAYTGKEAKSIKSFCDQLYGYYNHEDQFLLKSLMLGASFTLFRTFWSSLKNRWFLGFMDGGGVYSNGQWVHATNKDGQLMYKKFNLDPDGNIINVELTTTNTGEPFYIWKGSYLEGIATTIKECLLALFDPKSNIPISERAINILHGRTGNENEDVIKVRAANLKLFAHDLLIWAIIGLLIGSLLTKLLKELAKEDKNKKLGYGDMTIRSAESIFVSSLITSTLDLGAIRDLASPMTDWTPPSFRIIQNVWEDGAKVFTGDKSITKAITENISVLRQTENFWYKAEKAIKDEE